MWQNRLYNLSNKETKKALVMQIATLTGKYIDKLNLKTLEKLIFESWNSSITIFYNVYNFRTRNMNEVTSYF